MYLAPNPTFTLYTMLKPHNNGKIDPYNPFPHSPPPNPCQNEQNYILSSMIPNDGNRSNHIVGSRVHCAHHQFNIACTNSWYPISSMLSSLCCF